MCIRLRMIGRINLLNIIVGILLLSRFDSNAQQKQGILVVLPDSGMIVTNGRINKMGKQNEIDQNQMIEYIRSNLRERLSHLRTKYDIRFSDSLNNTFQSNVFASEYKLHTNFNIGDVLIKEKLAKIHVSHDQGYQHLYYSRAFNDEKMEFLRAYLSENGIRYLILINKFEVIKSLFFPKNNILSLHLEVYNSRLEKIAGSKNNYRMIVRKRMYYNVFEYSVKKTIDELYAELFKFLQDQ